LDPTPELVGLIPKIIALDKQFDQKEIPNEFNKESNGLAIEDLLMKNRAVQS